MTNFKREYDPKLDKYRCTSCGEWKRPEWFYRNPQYKYGLMSRCKDCHNAYCKGRYWRSKEDLEATRERLRTEFVPTGPPVELSDDALQALTDPDS